MMSKGTLYISIQDNTFRVSEGQSVNDHFQNSIWTPYKTLSNTGVWENLANHALEQRKLLFAWIVLSESAAKQLSSMLDCLFSRDSAPSTGGLHPSLAMSASHSTT